jgi:magnesium transporter
MAANWVDLLDPTPEELRARAPLELEAPVFELLTAQPAHDDEPRPTLRSHGRYVLGVFLVACALPDEDALFYQEIDVLVTSDCILTVRKTPPGGRPPFDIEPIRAAARNAEHPGMIAYHIIDGIGEKYLDLIDDIDAEIDELEDKVETQSAETTRQRISDLRHDMLHVRRTLSPMRDAVRRIVDNVIDVEAGTDAFPHEVELAFNSAYDKFLRAFDGLELSRDLLASVRDYHQSKIANDQNEVMKRLTVVASLLLVPTFIVGLYGQNFVNIPELHWHWGYWWSWGWIIATTVLQLWFFRRKRWI